MLLDVLRSYHGGKLILIDYRTHLECWESESNGYRQWGERNYRQWSRKNWEGFYRELEQELENFCTEFIADEKWW